MAYWKIKEYWYNPENTKYPHNVIVTCGDEGEEHYWRVPELCEQYEFVGGIVKNKVEATE